MRMKPWPVAALIALAMASPASAHHVMGGSAPVNFFDGLLSGLAHPVIELDHLAFVIALGLAAAFSAHGFRLVLLFIAGSLLGVMGQGLSSLVPHLELWVALSMVGLGLVFAARMFGGSLGWWVFVAVAGVLHGLAYGESIASSPGLAVISYLIGLAVTQAMLAVMAKTFVDLMRVDQSVLSTSGSRIVGAVMVALGMVFATTSLLPI